MTDATILARAITKSDPLERARFLGEACANNSSLRNQIEQILAAPSSAKTWANGKAPHESNDSSMPFLSPPERPDSLGRLGHYDVLDVLGRGGFGMVLRAFDSKLQRIVAIKVMLPEIAMTSPARNRFLREARAAAPIRDEHVVSIYAIESEPTPYLVMEFIPGQTLQQVLDQRGPLDAKEVVRIGVQLARGLSAAHAIGLIHRDIKPANIMIEDGADHRVKLTDFGLARAADDASLSQSGLIAGTPLYMAPEQARGETVDHRSDLFCLGSVLYTLVTGRPPFRADSSQAVLNRVVFDRPRPIRELIPETPRGLCRVIERLLEKAPADRYPDANAVAVALESQGLHDTPSPKRRSTFRTIQYLAAVLLLAVAGFLAFGFFVPPKQPTGVTWQNPIGMKFTRVATGTAWLGGRDGQPGNRPFELTQKMYAGTYEVTQGDWLKLMESNPSQFCRTGEHSEKVESLTDAEIAKLPVDFVSWNQAQEFLKRLNERHPIPDWTYRLPKSDEWEYLCRGGHGPREASATTFNVGEPSQPISHFANLKESSTGRTVAVGSFPPNRLGLYDMHGNVFELCLETRKTVDSTVATLRGGCWHDPNEFAQSNHFGSVAIENQYTGSGFRVVLVKNETR